MRVSLFLLLLVSACSAPSEPAAAQSYEPTAAQPADLSAAQRAALKASISGWMDGQDIAGISLAIANPDGSVWTYVEGQASSEEVLRDDHLLAVASITKTFTGAVILQLADEGQLSLDEPISRWLGDEAHIPGHATVRQLLNHTSGIANYAQHPSFGRTITQNPSIVYSGRDVIGQFLQAPAFEPGARSQYSNTNMVLLGLIAEEVTGTPLTDLFRTRLWEPVGLTHIFMPHLQEPTGPVAHGWASQGGTPLEMDPMTYASLYTAAGAAFGLMASPAEIARWGHALFTGDVLSDAMRQEMLTPVASPGLLAVETHIGLGIRGYAYHGRQQWGHSGAIWHGSSLMVFDPDTGYTIVVAMNQSPALHRSSHFRLMEDLLDAVAAR